MEAAASSTKRAPKGGAVGANGEFYEGGKFIATTNHAKRHGSVQKRASRVLIEPGVLAVAPEGMCSLFAQIDLFCRIANGCAIPAAKPETLAYYGRTARELEAMAARWNAGERWIAA